MKNERLKPGDGAKPRAFGTGLVALDLVISQQAGGATQHYAGGTCGNVLTILSFLGWEAYPITRLNADFTSQWVLEDLHRWGVHTDYASLGPTGPAPVIIEWITRDRRGRPSHRYSFACPTCGSRKPSHKPVLASTAKQLLETIEVPEVFFFDRVSRASVMLARHCYEQGSLIVFEPSGVGGDPKLFREALDVTHVLKYSSDRMGSTIADYPRKGVLLEIETRGAKGLRFRSRLPACDTSGWETLDALAVMEVRDAAGAGDWLTATFIDRVARSGLRTFLKTGARRLRAALRFGQAAAAWNCGFEAPRGGMYRCRGVDTFVRDVEAILDGRSSGTVESEEAKAVRPAAANSACLRCHGGHAA